MEKLAVKEYGQRMEVCTLRWCCWWWIYTSILVSSAVGGGVEEVRLEQVEEEVKMEVVTKMMEEVVKEDVKHVRIIEPLVRGSGLAPNCGGVGAGESPQ